MPTPQDLQDRARRLADEWDAELTPNLKPEQRAWLELRVAAELQDLEREMTAAAVEAVPGIVRKSYEAGKKGGEAS